MSFLDVVGWTGSALLIVSLLQARMMRLRGLNLVASLILVAFNWALGVWPMVAMNAVVAIIDLVHMIRLRAARKGAVAVDGETVPSLRTARP